MNKIAGNKILEKDCLECKVPANINLIKLLSVWNNHQRMSLLTDPSTHSDHNTETQHLSQQNPNRAYSMLLHLELINSKR